jgi:hypothetical protein
VADRILTEEAPRADGHAVASVLLDVDDHNAAGKSTLLRAISGTGAGVVQVPEGRQPRRCGRTPTSSVGGAENDRP